MTHNWEKYFCFNKVVKYHPEIHVEIIFIEDFTFCKRNKYNNLISKPNFTNTKNVPKKNKSSKKHSKRKPFTLIIF
jgi:hypothetical protein